MVLGLRSETPDEVKELFQRTGTLHLFAVSGLNVAMLASIVWYALKPLRVGRRASVAVIVPALVLYALVSALRSIWARCVEELKSRCACSSAYGFLRLDSLQRELPSVLSARGDGRDRAPRKRATRGSLHPALQVQFGHASIVRDHANEMHRVVDAAVVELERKPVVRLNRRWIFFSSEIFTPKHGS
jgi:hypothetical protein